MEICWAEHGGRCRLLSIASYISIGLSVLLFLALVVRCGLRKILFSWV